MESTLKGALPILASAFGQQFGVRVCIGGDTAWTNGDTIQIPVIDDPNLRDVVLGYLAHEAAHVRLTNFRAFGETEGVLRHLVNILEDVRIERGLYDHDYPGTKRTLCAVWEYASSKLTPDEGVIEGNLAALFCNYMLNRVRQSQFNSVSAQPNFEALKTAIEKALPPGFFVRLDVLFDMHFDSMDSTRDVVVFAKAILDALKQAEEDAQQANQKEASSDGESNAGGSQGLSSDLSTTSRDQSDEEAAGNQQGPSGQLSDDSAMKNAMKDDTGCSGDQYSFGLADEQSNQDSMSDLSNESGDTQNSHPPSTKQQGRSDSPTSSNQVSDCDHDGAGKGVKSIVEQILSETDLPDDLMASIGQHLSEHAAQVSSETGGSHRYVDLDTSVGQEITTDNIRRSVGEETLRDGVLNSSTLRSQMVGLLQSQARARTSHREYGTRFDAKRVARAMSGERRIWKHKEQKSMVNTSVHILLDTSSSMGQDQKIANSATVSLALAISAIPRADVAVSIFPGVGAGVSPLIKRKMPVRPNLSRFAMGPLGGTPMAEAMFFAAQELANVSNRHRKVMIVITDGEPNDGHSVNYITQLVEREIDVYAIGIKSDSVRRYFKNSQVISGVDQLQDALFDLAKEFLNIA